MFLKSIEELSCFEKVLDKCVRSVWVISTDGSQYDLKDKAERYQGITELLRYRKTDSEEPELFAACHRDEMELFDFFRMQKRLYDQVQTMQDRPS